MTPEEKLAEIQRRTTELVGVYKELLAAMKTPHQKRLFMLEYFERMRKGPSGLIFSFSFDQFYNWFLSTFRKIDKMCEESQDEEFTS